MKKILIVGGQESFTKTWAKQHFPDVGLEMAWFWNYERRNFPAFPRSAEAVIIMKEMCSHRHRNQAINQAKRWGIPFAEISRQWLRALPILEEKGIVPIHDTQEMEVSPMTTPTYTPTLQAEHPDWGEYLDILLLEHDVPNADDIIHRLKELIEPYPLTDEMQSEVRAKVNRKNLTYQQPQPQQKETPVSNYFQTSMTKAYDIVCAISQSDTDAIIKFVDKCQVVAKPNVPSRIRTVFMDHKVDNPTLFSGVLYHIFNEHDCTTTPELINKAYVRIMGRKHNYTKPREVFAWYNCDWEVHDISALTETTETDQEFHGQESVVEDTVSGGYTEAVAVLTAQVSDLLGTVNQLKEQNAQLLEQIKNITVSTERADVSDSVVIPKSELIEYIINNKLNITIK